MAKKQRPWEQFGFERGEAIPGGNQGHTFLARRIGQSEDYCFVLKTLKRQENPLSRRRFHVEVESLRVLDFPGVSKLVATNAGDFASEEELFVVTERVLGQDLGSYGLPLSFDAACRVIGKVLAILQKCHELGVVHRDIKPCHAILRNGDADDPVLIDFGLAYNEELIHTADLTAIEQGVGNRFILLPEQLDGQNKRSPVSDVTQCLGLLFFLLTGDRPGLIGGPGGTNPYERVEFEKLAETLPPYTFKRLRATFEVGFQWDLTRRWQVASELADELAILTNSDRIDDPANFDAQLAVIIGNATNNPELELHRRTDYLFEQFRKLCLEYGKRVIKSSSSLLKLSSNVSGSAGKTQVNWQGQQIFGDRQARTLVMIAERAGAELVLSSHLIDPKLRSTHGPSKGQPVQIKLLHTRVSLVDPRAEALLEEFASRTWLGATECLLGTGTSTPASEESSQTRVVGGF